MYLLADVEFCQDGPQFSSATILQFEAAVGRCTVYAVVLNIRYEEIRYHSLQLRQTLPQLYPIYILSRDDRFQSQSGHKEVWKSLYFCLGSNRLIQSVGNGIQFINYHLKELLFCCEKFWIKWRELKGEFISTRFGCSQFHQVAGLSSSSSGQNVPNLTFQFRNFNSSFIVLFTYSSFINECRTFPQKAVAYKDSQ